MIATSRAQASWSAIDMLVTGLRVKNGSFLDLVFFNAEFAVFVAVDFCDREALSAKSVRGCHQLFASAYGLPRVIPLNESA